MAGHFKLYVRAAQIMRWAELAKLERKPQNPSMSYKEAQVI